IEGWTVPEARMFLRDLTEHATQCEFVYSHAWRVNDLVMWDNRCTMHRARRFDRDEVRDVRRTTLAGHAPTVEQVEASGGRGGQPGPRRSSSTGALKPTAAACSSSSKRTSKPTPRSTGSPSTRSGATAPTACSST